MRLLKDIPKNKYNDVKFNLDWLNDNRTIGDDSINPIEYFHCFWVGIINDLHIKSIKSLINTHKTGQIIFWVLDNTNNWTSISELDRVTIKIISKAHFEEAGMLDLFDSVRSGQDLAYVSDIIRFLALYLLGGIWFDLDIIFLRDLNTIKIKRYVSQWGTDWCGNAAIMRLEKGHNLINIIKNKYNKPFFPLTSLQLDNELDITILPSTFFDVLWRPSDQIPDSIQFKHFDDFFTVNILDLPEQLYAYHWHNRWNKKILF